MTWGAYLLKTLHIYYKGGQRGLHGGCSVVHFTGRAKVFLISQASELWTPFSGVIRPGRKAHHSPPCNVQVINEWIYTSALPHSFIILKCDYAML
jgi:hypothetical protein